MSFEEELTGLLNRYSIENESDTPDFVLAQFVLDCLGAWKKATAARDRVVPVGVSCTKRPWLD